MHLKLPPLSEFGAFTVIQAKIDAIFSLGGDAPHLAADLSEFGHEFRIVVLQPIIMSIVRERVRSSATAEQKQLAWDESDAHYFGWKGLTGSECIPWVRQFAI